MQKSLIDLLRKADKEDYESRTQDEHYAYMADFLIANGVTIQKWIPVSERLPEESGEYLVYCGEYDGICVLYYENKWRSKWKEVTHWMPLPEPPKEDQQ